MQRGRWAVAAMFFANGFVTGAWAPQIPLLLPRHGIDKIGLGLLILVLGVGAVGAMLFSGRLIARHGSHRVLAVFGLAAVAALPMVVLAPNLWLLAPAMAAFGALLGTMDVAMNANAVEVERRLDRAIMSSSHGFWSLGGFVGGALGGVVLAGAGAVAQALIAAGVMLVIVLAALPRIETDPPAATAAADTGNTGGAILPRDPALWLIGGLALASMVPEGAVLDWSALYLREALGVGEAESGLAFAFFAGAMAAMRFAGDAARGRFGAVAVLRASALIGAAGLAVAAAAPAAWVAVAGFFLAGLGIANMMPIMLSAAGNHPGLPRGVGISTVAMLGYSGILVAPSSIGLVAEQLGFRITFAALALLLTVVAAMAARVAMADRPA